MMNVFTIRSACALAATALLSVLPVARAAEIDVLTFGDAASEQAHGVVAEHSDVTTGGLGESARRLLPVDPAGWQGGTVSFSVKVDPAKPNYFTLRFWGGDATSSRMILFCEGKQIGQLHLGEVDVLDTPNGKPALPGRFFYVTTPLPVDLTRGKSSLSCEIRSTGRVWSYGRTFEQYQKPMTEPARGLYRAYTHTDGYFAPPAAEKQGIAPANPPLRETPGAEVLDQVKQRVNGAIDGLLKRDKPLSQVELWFVARAAGVRWTTAYDNPTAVKKVVEGIDTCYRAFKADPSIVMNEKSTYNPDWFGFGPAGQSIVLLGDALKPLLDAPIEGAASISRRDGWTEMLVASRDQHRQARRQYTNQSMIKDTYGIYLSNRGVAALSPDKAMPEPEVRRYLYESAGLQPWLGSEKDGVPQKPLGDSYMQLTAKGLTKELGFVGYYGEVLDWMTAMYDATRPSPDQPGDERLKAALVKAASARAAFRYPEVDGEGNRAMRAEAVIGWRDMDHYPGDIMYAQRSTRDASAIESAAATRDPMLAGYAQQMLADNQFFASVVSQMQEKTLRATAGLLAIPDDYETIKTLPASPQRLPLSTGSGDFVFTDEEDGVVALRHGETILYASLYWRARHGINNLARVHEITPQYDRIAIVRQETQFEPSGQFYTRQNWINFGFANGGLKYPVEWQSAHAGEKLPIAKIPEGIKFKPGDENVHAGKGDFYTLRYGPYLIGMNCSANKTFTLAVPADAKNARELIGAKAADPGVPQEIPPRSTVVLYLGE